MEYYFMRYLISNNLEHLIDLNIGIMCGLKEEYNSEGAIYASILTDRRGSYALPIDEEDKRNPMKYLEKEDADKTINKLEGEWVNV